MTAPFRLYGAELSPYSVKVRSYLRYKGVEFDWVARTNARQEEFQRYAKLPLIRCWSMRMSALRIHTDHRTAGAYSPSRRHS
jgi:hypothetical protein